MTTNCQDSRLTNRRKSEGALITPGPGCYYVPRDLCKRSVSFARASRSSDKCRLSPGPGSYNIPSDLGKGPRVVFQTGRTSSDLGCAPGPSDYSPYYAFSSIRYSFPKHSSQKGSIVTPGPCDYNVVLKSHVPRATIGRAKRLLLDIGNSSSIEPSCDQSKSKNLSRKSSNCFQTQWSSFAPKSKEVLKRESFTRKKGQENAAPLRSTSVKKGKKL